MREKRLTGIGQGAKERGSSADLIVALLELYMELTG
jgi:hypothetical protein